MRDLPSGTVTFLFTDVEGSTRLLHSLGPEGYAEALAEHRLVIRKACARHEGVEVDTQGDAFFFAFPTAPGAIAAASEMTEALAAGPIQVRIGVHTGTPLLTDEGYVGGDVHFAARVAASGYGGQILVSFSTAAAVTPSNSLLQGASLTDLGEHRLKDIEGSVSIFQLGDGSFPPLKTISNTNLPRPASSFVGREAELSEVLSRIEGGARLVTLTGPGGSGKTRLALEAASSLLPEYKAGTFWVGLAALRDPALVTETISQTLGAKDGLAEHIAEREMLLLLDNLEQVIEAAPELSSLLSLCPNLTLLATSRELLRVQGEVEYPVPPLAEPEAVSLFCERSGLESSEDLSELCTRLDSLPLAVELAAARAKALSPAQILERLTQRLDLLKGGRDADPRQQTLRATIEWSYDLLTLEEQQLFARLSVFAGGCALEAAEEVCDANLDTLQSLVEKSLLRYTNERFWMLETIREYAAERLDSGEANELRRWHAEFYRDLALRMDAELRGDHDDVLLDRLTEEHDNARAVLTWSVAGGDVDVGMRLATAMERFWWIRGHVAEGRRWLAELLEFRDRVTPELLALGLAEDAWLAGEEEKWDDALTRGADALKIARQLGDGRLVRRALEALGGAYGSVGRYSDAEAAYEESLLLARQLGDRFSEAASTYNLGETAHEQGDLSRAHALIEEALHLARQIGTQEGVASSLLGLGSVLRREGRLEESLEMLRSGLIEVVRLGFPIRIAGGLLEVAAALSEKGEHERAARLLGAAESAFDEAGVSSDEDLVEEIATGLIPELGEEMFSQLSAEGRAMSTDEAVECALSSID
ncbi:MAG: Adenylate/guanylate cyclase protein [Thermoleophilia bacterium]|nr:Adenylate/guanylate cyclase protein [Thermoleophilia bacterium]